MAEFDAINEEILKNENKFKELTNDLESEDNLVEAYGITHYIEILIRSLEAYGNRISELYLGLILDKTEISDTNKKKLDSISTRFAPIVFLHEGQIVSANGPLREVIMSKAQAIKSNKEVITNFKNIVANATRKQ